MTRTIDANDRAALQAFANAHGKKWKDTLACVYWYNARIWTGGTPNDGYVLHAIRNSFGPKWLYNVCDVKPGKES